MNLVLSRSELHQVTGYKRPGDQLAELRRQGFYRARFSKVLGEVILERAHYDAVCAGRALAAEPDRPRVRIPQLRTV